MMRGTPMVYYYGAAAHCVDCAKAARMDGENTVALTPEGVEYNPVTVGFEWSEDAWDETCDDCGQLCRTVYGFAEYTASSRGAASYIRHDGYRYIRQYHVNAGERWALWEQRAGKMRRVGTAITYTDAGAFLGLA